MAMARMTGEDDSLRSGWCFEWPGLQYEDQSVLSSNDIKSESSDVTSNHIIGATKSSEEPGRQDEEQLKLSIMSLKAESFEETDSEDKYQSILSTNDLKLSVESEPSLGTQIITLESSDEPVDEYEEQSGFVNQNLKIDVSEAFHGSGPLREEQSEFLFSDPIFSLDKFSNEFSEVSGHQYESHSESSRLENENSEFSPGLSREYESEFSGRTEIITLKSSDESDHDYVEQSEIFFSDSNISDNEISLQPNGDNGLSSLLSNLNIASADEPSYKCEDKSDFSTSNINIGADSTRMPFCQYKEQLELAIRSDLKIWPFCQNKDESELSTSNPKIGTDSSEMPMCQYKDQLESAIRCDLNIGARKEQSDHSISTLSKSSDVLDPLSEDHSEFSIRSPESAEELDNLGHQSDDALEFSIRNLNIGGAESSESLIHTYKKQPEASISNINIEGGFSSKMPGCQYKEQSQHYLNNLTFGVAESSKAPGRQYVDQSEHNISNLNIGGGTFFKMNGNQIEELSGHFNNKLNIGGSESSKESSPQYKDESEHSISNFPIRDAEPPKMLGRQYVDQSDHIISNINIGGAESSERPFDEYKELSERSIGVSESSKMLGSQYKDQSEHTINNLNIGDAETNDEPVCVCVEERKLVVSNLSSRVSEVDLHDLFIEFGSIRSSSINYNSRGRHLGSAQVEYIEGRDAMEALKKLNGAVLDGWALEIKISVKCEQDYNLNEKALSDQKQQKQDAVQPAIGVQEIPPTLEDVKTNVRLRVINKIEEINNKIDDRTRRYNDKVLNQKSELKKRHSWEWGYLIRKHNNEETHLNEKYREEKESLFQKQLEEKTKLDARHTDEEASIEKNIRKAEGDENYLTSLRKMRDQLIQDLDKVDNSARDSASSNDHRSLRAARDTLECPICLEFMNPPTRIWMCPSSHIVCEPCWSVLKGKFCPTCRTERVTRRAHIAENFARSVFDEEDGNGS